MKSVELAGICGESIVKSSGPSDLSSKRVIVIVHSANVITLVRATCDVATACGPATFYYL